MMRANGRTIRSLWDRCIWNNYHVFERVGEQLATDPWLRAKIITCRNHVFGDKLRVKPRERYFVLKVKRVEQVSHDFFGKFKPVRIANALENLSVFIRRGRIDFHLVMDAP